MIYVTGIRVQSGGNRPSHITHLRWEEVGTTKADIWLKQRLVDWIDKEGGSAAVRNPYGADAPVHTVHPAIAPDYVQTKADDTTADNLMSLPRI